MQCDHPTRNVNSLLVYKGLSMNIRDTVCHLMIPQVRFSYPFFIDPVDFDSCIQSCDHLGQIIISWCIIQFLSLQYSQELCPSSYSHRICIITCSRRSESGSPLSNRDTTSLWPFIRAELIGFLLACVIINYEVECIKHLFHTNIKNSFWISSLTVINKSKIIKTLRECYCMIITLFTQLGFAPSFRSTVTISLCPCSAAVCRAVLPNYIKECHGKDRALAVVTHIYKG